MRIAILVFGFSSAISTPLIAQQALPVAPAAPLVPVAANQLTGDVSPSRATITNAVVPSSVMTPTGATNTANASTAVIMSASTGPTAGAARAGVAPRESKELTVNTKSPDRHVGAGQNVALMVVGGAALITGLIVGGDGGTLLAVGGAVVGLFGLYNFVK